MAVLCLEHHLKHTKQLLIFFSLLLNLKKLDTCAPWRRSKSTTSWLSFSLFPLEVMYSANTGGWSKPSSLLAAIFGLAPFSSRTRTISARFATLSAQATCRAEPRMDEVLLTSAPKLTRLINFSIYSSMIYPTFSYRLQWASWRAQRPLSAQLNLK